MLTKAPVNANVHVSDRFFLKKNKEGLYQFNEWHDISYHDTTTASIEW